MSLCDDCTIDDKVYECCGRHPETGKQVRYFIGSGAPVLACPHLSITGKCTTYENRPHACQLHFCYLYQKIDNIGQGWQDLEDFLNLF